jgi:hypothetical protein
MDAMRKWGGLRYATFTVVLLLHAALIAALLAAKLPRNDHTFTQPSVEVLLLPRSSFPKKPLEISMPRLLGGNASISVAPPTLNPSTATISPAPVASTSGERAGVDWGAEARRALQSYEIRRRQPGGDRALSGQPEDEYWIMHAQRHPGDRFKTPSGDWVVWINDDCYHVVSAESAASDPGVTSREVVCRERPPPETP